jgi:hypothetical protein
MKTKFRVLAACAAMCPAGGMATAQFYSFDEDAQGWRIFNVGMSGHHAGAVPGVAAPWEALVGNPDGGLRVGDLTGETCIGAPAGALGERSDLYGSVLAYDALFSTADNAAYSAAVLAGATVTLYFPRAKPALGSYQHIEIPLTESGWRVGGDGGAAATQAQFQGVLADLRGVFIRAEWTTGPDDTRFDNIRIGNACLADLTGDGTVDLGDFFEFFNCWDLSEPCADIDGNPGVDLGDFFTFFGHFDVSC